MLSLQYRNKEKQQPLKIKNMKTLNYILHHSAINSESFNRTLASITISIIVAALVISLI